jgi:ATP-dependent RNA helicase DeaD
MENPDSAIVFCRTRLEVDELTETLNAHGYRCEALHGGLAQRDRDRVMRVFRSGKADLLVATDVAARGLDIPQLSHVVNYDVPSAAEAYVHRIGRTGRVGRTGVAITLAEPREQRLLRNIEAFTKQRIDIGTVPSVTDLKARRLDRLRDSVRKRMLEGGLEDARTVVQSLAAEFDLLDVAAAAVQMADTAAGAGKDEREIPLAARPVEEARARPSPRPGPAPGRARPFSSRPPWKKGGRGGHSPR